MFNFLSSLNLRKKLIILTVFFISCLCFISIVFYQTLSKLKVNGPLYKNIVQSKDLIADILPPPEYIIESYLTVMQMQYTDSLEKIKSLQDKLQSLKNDYEARHAFWIKDLPDDNMKKILIENSYRYAKEFFDIYESEFLPLILKKDKTASMSLLSGSLSNKYEAHRKEIDSVVLMATERNKSDETIAASINKTSNIQIVTLVIASLIISITISYLITSSIRSLVIKIKNVSNTVSSSSTQMLAATKELSAGAILQNDNIISIKASIEEMAASIQEVSASSVNTGKMSLSARDQSDTGLHAVKSVNAGMNEINSSVDDVSVKISELAESNKEIGKIVQAITTISEQTNLLALNAAIEAARAGEYGRGFAVVADEVRNLANRSQKSALEIADIIGRIQKGMSNAYESMQCSSSCAKNGIKNAEELDAAFQKIKDSIDSASVGIQEISTAISEQAKASDAIAASVESVSAVVNKTAGSSSELVMQGEHMLTITYTLNELCAKM